MTYTYSKDILARTLTVWGGLRTRPYRMFDPGRADCSYYVWDVFGLPKPTLSTVEIIKYFEPVAVADARPGHIWGKIGPNTGGANGHVAVIVQTPSTQGRWLVRHQAGPTGAYGPTEAAFINVPTGYKIYRIKGFTEGFDSMSTYIVRTDDGPGRKLTNGLSYRDLLNGADMDNAIANGAKVADQDVTPVEFLGVNLASLSSGGADSEVIANALWDRFAALFGR